MSVFDALSTLKDGADRRMKIYIAAAREMYRLREFDLVVWLPTRYQLADGLTKSLPGPIHKHPLLLLAATATLRFLQNVIKTKTALKDFRVETKFRMGLHAAYCD